tara:strand:- start:990 stop:1427 length:438 start_codon:yes stop_codon:yes gene_type:complete
MGTTKAGFVLALIGGVIGVLAGLALAVMAFFVVPVGEPSIDWTNFGVGIYFIISGILVILGGAWMKNPEKCTKGGVVALIFSIIGSGGIFGLIGGIIGIVKGKKHSVSIEGAPQEAAPVEAQPEAQAPAQPEVQPEVEQPEQPKA